MKNSIDLVFIQIHIAEVFVILLIVVKVPTAFAQVAIHKNHLPFFKYTTKQALLQEKTAATFTAAAVQRILGIGLTRSRLVNETAPFVFSGLPEPCSPEPPRHFSALHLPQEH